jgi:nucleoside-diphosphate-sugar epimerase
VVWGPPVLLPKDPAKLNETLRPIYALLSPETSEVQPNIGSANFVDVRDVAFMHIWAYEHPSEADGERYIAASGFGPVQGAADILRQHYKGTKFEKAISVGKPGEGYLGYVSETGTVGKVEFLPEGQKMSGKKAEEKMGIKWHTFNQSVVDTAKALEPLL